ncbi:amine oxidase [Metarhizium album ARSEF 1941]|uniref:Amine oxidase n=1 Tax=Metarhizium album (strain ARSEF 1941) TaxID=1081103 RepID=A0A0B2X875_METAS|nr:amine oxidase [Metarhizium album ARSEF 1941]KHO01973.1 amine oxidase [Metarhizium album ARSEF 1941]
MTGQSRRIAIVGGGIAGMACSWELRKPSAQNVTVDIYESENKLGGHANSVPFRGNGTTVDVDTGFIVMDEATYPRFNAFLGELGIRTIPTDMSFAVTTTDRSFEWSSRSVFSFIATLTLLLSPWLWRLMFDIIRFSLFAEDILHEQRSPRREKYAAHTAQTGGNASDAEETRIVSTSLESIGAYLTRQGYSRNEVLISFLDGTQKTFDHVVLAVHANQAATLLGDDVTALERKILGGFKTSRNTCYLHSDTSLLPRRLSARAAWNCTLAPHTPTAAQDHVKQNEGNHGRKLSLTFDMNRLQEIPRPGEPGSPGRVLVSMNPVRAPRSVQSSHVYCHPIINSECILMARHLHKINGIRRVGFAGAWMGFGFHEDGFAAGVHAARTFMDGWDKTPPLDLIGDGEGIQPPRNGFLRASLRFWVRAVQRLLQPQPWP